MNDDPTTWSDLNHLQKQNNEDTQNRDNPTKQPIIFGLN